MTTLFLFAHQDDEIGVFHEIAEAKRLGNAVLCVYLTNGAWAGVTSQQRNTESANALSALGVAASELKFLGTEIAIPDGALIEHLDRCLEAVLALIQKNQSRDTRISRVVMHAWEGGHQDHDAGHLIGVAVAQTLGILQQSRQFPLYRMPATRWSMTFATPLPENGPIETTPIPAASRLNYIRLLANYRSQKRVILKLLPLIVRDYAMKGVQRLQPVSLARIQRDPVARPMLYEIWKLYSYDRFAELAHAFVNGNGALSIGRPKEPK